ncbi:hypothetical protein VTK73DRAFT_7753 [Phialemonium thermophilum]|uniref:AB hydrolase-1 domain-containing protein n=1 Tax=Phialemonium thermophilum TaxID=223376 RepID=A0ABR3XRF1_9PEZI
MPVPFLGRLNIVEYVALVGSFIFVGFEAAIRVFTLALPSSLLSLFYRASRRLFNRLTSPAQKRAQQRRNSTSTRIRDACDFVDLCALFGYTAEEHVVQTKDGYLLGLHRLAWRKGEEDRRVNAGPNSLKKRVVYLHHGLLMNSEVWVCLTDAERALPFALVERGFDVWFGNNRGNKYSKKSVHHSPASTKFWNFSIDEFAFHDIPDSIDYILATTGQPSLSYVGFSQGTAQAFAALAIHPKLNDQVNVFIALAPAMSPAGLHNGIVDALVKASPQVLYLLFGRRSILSSATLWQSLLYPPLFAKLIDLGLGFLFNWKTRNISVSQKLAAYPHLYSYTSTKSVVHWFQIIRNRCFQMFDDDVHQPLLRLSGAGGSKYTKVAKYPTRNIRTPVVLLYGGSDSLVDIRVMLRELPPRTLATEIPHYEHLDFLWARDVHVHVFPHVFDALESFTGAEHSAAEYEQYRTTRRRTLSVNGRAGPLRHHEIFDGATALGEEGRGHVSRVEEEGEEERGKPQRGSPTLSSPSFLTPADAAAAAAAAAQPRDQGYESARSSSPKVQAAASEASGVRGGGESGAAADRANSAANIAARVEPRTAPSGERPSSASSQLSFNSLRDGRGIALGTSRAVGGVTRTGAEAVANAGAAGQESESKRRRRL